MFKKSIILILTLFILISPSFALDNQTDVLAVGDVKSATIDIYVNASNEQTGSGSQSNPYQDLKPIKWDSGSVVHIAEGEYNYRSFNSLNNVTIIGEHADKTIINCNLLEISATNLVLKNLTLVGATFKNQGNFTAQNVIFKDGVGKALDEYGNSYGGAIYTSYRDDGEKYLISLDNCSFINNNAEYGGAIYIDGGFLEINKCFFINNHAYNYGGAIAISFADKITIKKSQFINNNALNDAGGAIYSVCSSLTMDGVDIGNCSSTFGAAITALNTKLDINNLYAFNNVAKYNGGAIYQMYSTSLITSSKFVNNSAVNGGALFLDNVTSLFLLSNKFLNNSAKQSAGAIYSILNKEYQNSGNIYENNRASENNDVFTASKINNIIVSSNQTTIQYTPQGDIILPDYYSLLDDGFVSPVKDQQDSGNCWSFSAMAALESCILKAINKTYDLSEENMKNIMASFSDYGWSIDVNMGGYDEMAIGYLTGWLGPVHDSDDKFDDNGALSPLLNSLLHVQNVVFIKRENYLDNDGIKEAILRYGGVSTGIYYSSMYLSEHNAYYYYDNLMPSNHAVTIVGWDDNYSRFNFGYHVPEGDGAFIVKNSWGTDWGNDGYFYVSYYDKRFAQVGESEVSYTFILNDTFKYDKNYQYDVVGKSDYLITGEKTLWYQNIFNATDEEYLAAVATYFNEYTEWEVSIYVNGVFKTSTSGSSNAGYYTINLGNLVHLNKGDEFRVMFKVTAQEHAKIPILEERYINKLTFGYGISYFSRDGENWTDLYKFVFSDFNRRCESQVAAIKAFTIFNTINSTIRLDISNKGLDSVNVTANVYDSYGNPINSGNVTFTVDGVKYTVIVNNGVANFRYAFKNNSNTIVDAVFAAENYGSSSSSIEIEYYGSNIQLNMNNIVYGQLLTAEITLTDDEGNFLTDNVNLTVGNVNYNIHVDGKKTFYVPAIMDVGSYEFVLNYNDKLTDSASVNITQRFVSMDVSFRETTNDLTINVQFSNAINEVINISISGKKYVVNVVNGRASLFVDDLDFGSHDIVVSFENKNYNKIQKNYTIVTTVYKSKITPIKMEYVENGVYYWINLAKYDGTPIKGEQITFVIDGTQYKNITDDNGNACVLINLNNGNYDARLSFEEDGDVVGCILDTTIIVNRTLVEVQNVVAPGVISVYDNKYINISFTDYANGKLVVLIDTKEYLNCHFNSNELLIPLSDLAIGNHKIQVGYSGIGGYSYSKTFDVSVIKSNPVIEVSYDNCYSGEVITFTFNLPDHASGFIFVDIGGKSYYSKINDGVAVIKIDGLSAGTKQLAYSYDGDKNYNPVNGNITFNVVSKFKLTLNKDITMFYTAGSYYKVKVVTAKGETVTSGYVVIVIDGKSYNVKVDKNGWASFKITLKPKTYTISAKYDEVKVSNKVVVKSILKSYNYNVKKAAKKLTVTANLSKVNGKYLKGKTITFKFNGKKYTAKTNSKGVAQLTISKNVIKKLKANKKYTMEVSYLQDSVKKIISVKK